MSEKNMYREWFKVKRSKNKRMFPFIDITPNPLGGSCYGCSYCYIHGINGMKKRFPHIREKYSYNFRLYDHILERTYKDKAIFFCDCIDWLHHGNSTENVYKIIEWIERSPSSTFLSLTKNPNRYLELRDDLPVNMILGITGESNIEYPDISNAPNVYRRFRNFIKVSSHRKLLQYPRLISIEPIQKFDMNEFVFYIQSCDPNCVVIGYDSHGCKLKEPTLKETLSLIRILEDKGILVIKKLIRKAWHE
jgi:hypothetical protein